MAKYVSNRKSVDAELQRVFWLILAGTGEIVSSKAKLLSPVYTGRLRDSIEYQVNLPDKEVIVGTPVEYAPYLELGTSKQRQQPFIVPALLKSQTAIKLLAEKIIGGAFK